MTDPFMRVDLSQRSRDFQPVALEPGLPLLDKTNSNWQTLRKWLGAFVAEVERVADRVGFYVRDDDGARLNNISCFPVTDKDLSGELAKDLKELRRRMESAKPATPNEQLIHRVVVEQIKLVCDDPQAPDRHCCLLRYRGANNKWKLLWCPGYRRRDNEPASPLVCTNPSCLCLFLQRRSTGSKCPVCQKIREKRPGDTGQRSGYGRALSRWIALLLLLGLGLAGGSWWMLKPTGNSTAPLAPLTVEPGEWTGPVGGQVPFVVMHNPDQKSEDVSNAVAVIVADPKIITVKKGESLATAKSPGKTEVTFYYGDHTAKALVTVEPRQNPKSLRIEPEKLEVGVGTTGQLKLLGVYDNNPAVDLTGEAEWTDVGNSAKFELHRGSVEGTEPGTGKVQARYRANPTDEYLDATAEITVKDHQYKSLNVTLAPAKPKVGQPAKVKAVATTDSGQAIPIGESQDLKLELLPADNGALHGLELTATAEGPLKLKAEFRGLSATVDAIVGKGEASTGPLQVSPTQLELKLGEIASLSIRSPKPDKVSISSKMPDQVEVAADGRLIGRSLGATEIEVTDGTGSAKVAVTVSAADWTALAIEPSKLIVHADETATFRVFGVQDERHRVELAADQVTWTDLPRPDFVEFDRDQLQIKGLKTTGAQTERLSGRNREAQATVEIQVTTAPLTLTLSPEKSLEIPFGQKRSLTVQARYGATDPVDVPPDRIEWVASSTEGFDIKNGEVHAKEPDAAMRLAAKYQGATSNEVRVSSVAGTPLTLKATAEPPSIATGGVGRIVVEAMGPAGPVPISEDGLLFISTTPNVLQISEVEGAYRGMSPGQAVVQVSHMAAKTPVEVTVDVTEAAVETVEKPTSLRIVSDPASPVALPVMSEFSGFKVEATGADGVVTDVTRQATLEVDGNPAEAPVVVLNGRIMAVSPGSAVVQARYNGALTTGGLAINVSAELDIDELRITPAELQLVAGESTTLRAFGFKAGKNVGDITARRELEWKARDSGPIELRGPAVSAKAPGSTSATVQFGSVVSKPVPISVQDKLASLARLTVHPGALTLRVGEVIRIGSDVNIARGGVDFSDQCDVSPASDIVHFQPDSRTLTAQLTGRTQVTFTLREQAATIDVDVLPEEPLPADSQVVVEPATGRIAVGELLPVRVFVITPDGRRRSTTASLSSSDRAIATTKTADVLGHSPGDVTVQAHVPGIDRPGQAQYKVVDLEFDQLVFVPAAAHLSVGESKRFSVEAVTSEGRKTLGDHPRLKLFREDDQAKIVELSAPQRELRGLQAGTATVIARWNNRQEARLPVNVTLDPIQELLIEPAQIKIAEGASATVQVFAKHRTWLERLTAEDGLDVQVANSVVASLDPNELRAVGQQAGTTKVTARYGTRRAEASLIVTPPGSSGKGGGSKGDSGGKSGNKGKQGGGGGGKKPPGGGGPKKPPAPPAKPKSLRFVTNPLEITLDSPGRNLRVVRVLADNSEEDVSHLVTITVSEPKDVVEIDRNGSGALARPLRIGQTQVDAALPDSTLQTDRPLRVVVTEKSVTPPRLRVSPSSLDLEVGESRRFVRAEVVPSSGDPIPVKFTVKAQANDIFELRPDGSLRGLKAGSGICTIVADDPAGPYDGMKAEAAVTVSDVKKTPPPPRRLELTGPTQTTVGAEAPLFVELVQGDRSTDVTNQARLSLAVGDEAFAELLPGGRLLAKRAGRVTVDASQGELTALPLEIEIRPPATDFEKLELDVDRNSIAVGESRPFRLWGYPRGGGARQDLTSRIANDNSDPTQPMISLEVLKPDVNATVAVVQPGHLVGRQPGRFSAQARLGNRLATEPIEFDVLGSVEAPIQMRVEPEAILIRTGETTPPVRVLVASSGERQFRTVDPALVEINAMNAELLQPDGPGQFRGLKPGKTRLKVSYGGLEQSVPVTIGYDAFARVEFEHDPLLKDNTVTVDLLVAADTVETDLDYRTTVTQPDGRTVEMPWMRAEREGNELVAHVKSPPLPTVRGQNSYSMIIEAKDAKTGRVEKHPFTFRIIPKKPGEAAGRGGADVKDPPGPEEPALSDADDPESESNPLPNVPEGPGGPPGRATACRGGAAKKNCLKAYGGTQRSEDAVSAGLDWLARHQLDDGSWSLDHTACQSCQGQCSQPGSYRNCHVAATGLALLAYLGSGHTHEEGDYQPQVRRGLDALVNMGKTVPAGFRMADDEPSAAMYSQGIATIALSEAYAMTQDVRFRPKALGGVKFIANAQDPKRGGWRYQPRETGDTSVLGWQVMALKSAQNANVRVGSKTLKRASFFLNNVGSDGGAQYGYMGTGDAAPSTTAIGLLCRMYNGQDRRHPGLREGVKYLDRTRPQPNNMYFNYYATQVMFHWGGDDWARWNETMRDQLTETQHDSSRGHSAGSWDVADQHGGVAGRHYMTCLAIMTLEIYYRHMPLYQHI